MKPLDSLCALTGIQMAEGNTLAQAGRFTEGKAKLLSALEALELRGTPDPVNRACLMNMIGFLDQQERRSDLALQWFQRALEAKPPFDNLVLVLTVNLANAFADLHRLDEAEKAARRALELSVRVFGPDHEETLLPIAMLAFIKVARGDFASAEPVLRRVLAFAERNWRESSYLRAQAAANLGVIYFIDRRYAMARDLLQKSLVGLEQNPIRAKDEIPLTQALLAVSYAAEGQRQEANIWLGRALARAQQELSQDDPALALVLERGATAKFYLKDYDSGSELFDRAIAVLEAAYGPGSEPVLDALDRYSALVRAAKDKNRARILEARRKAFAGKR
jgi:tetratricopeptide (TPR) repeat protein